MRNRRQKCISPVNKLAEVATCTVERLVQMKRILLEQILLFSLALRQKLSVVMLMCRQVQKAAAGSRLPVYEGGQIQYDRAGQLSEGKVRQIRHRMVCNPPMIHKLHTTTVSWYLFPLDGCRPRS